MAAEEEDQIKELFQTADRDSNGRISTKELGRMFKAIGVKLSPKDVKKMVYKFDTDASKDIDLDEFRSLIKDVLDTNKVYEEAYETFRLFDANGDNTITRDEARKAVNSLSKPLNDTEFEEFMKRLDADGNGIVHFDEFAKAYACGL